MKAIKTTNERLVILEKKVGTLVKKIEKDSSPKANNILFNQAIKISQETGKISALLLQRRLKIGYAAAAQLIDELEEKKYISSPDAYHKS